MYQDRQKTREVEPMQSRMYSAFEVKSLDASKRTFRGWATTPATDRVGDVVNSLGATFTNPLVMLHQHNHSAPVGLVRFDKPTKKGIEFEAEIPDVAEAGLLKDRVDMAWGEVKYGLVRAVSIGFRPIKYAFKDDGGIDFQEVEIYELSMVSIPALAEAVITQVKAMNGAPLPHDLVRSIASMDHVARRGGPVQLTRRTLAGAGNGSVSLTR